MIRCHPAALRWLLLVLLAGLAAPPARACSVPVFRYALERWPPEPYEAFLFHRGPLAPADRAAADALERGGDPAGPAPNVALERIDVAAPMPERLEALWAARKDAALPWLVVRYPTSPDGEGPVLWSGPLTAGAAGRLVQSAARREVARRLLGGDATVWVLLGCGDRAKDDAAAAMLEAELRKLEKSLELPNPDAPDDDDGPAAPLRSPRPLRLAFSSLRVQRGDAAEQPFVAMLVRSAGGRPLPEDRPAVFPVFGRGRVLGALGADDLHAESIREAAEFLTGPCSCRVKELNPGVDLLMAADWDAFLEEPVVKDPEVPNLASVGPALAGAGAAPAPAAPASSGGGIPLPLAVALAAVVGFGVIAVVAATWILRRRPPG